jgi:hypothetical protein
LIGGRAGGHWTLKVAAETDSEKLKVKAGTVTLGMIRENYLTSPYKHGPSHRFFHYKIIPASGGFVSCRL